MSNNAGQKSRKVSLLSVNESVTFLDGTTAKVIPDRDRPNCSDGVLGRGGQGVVYNVEHEGKNYALKWYTNEEFFKTEEDSRFYDNIVHLSKDKITENILENFTLPIKVTKSERNGQFGYLMNMIPMSMVPMSKILSQDSLFKYLDKQLEACRNIAFAFSILHTNGMVFTDINEGSIFFDTNTAKVMICDCDNIVPETEKPIRVGKIGYMAPEVINGSVCSKESDCFSLAVIIFLLLFRCDPYEGSKYNGQIMDKDVIRKMYVDDPIFIFDPDNRENMAAPELCEAWEHVPEDIKDCFYKTLAKGAKDPSSRLKASYWDAEMNAWETILKRNPRNNRRMAPIKRRTQIVMFIVDVSASMKGYKIDSVNKAISHCIEELKKLENDKKNSSVHFAISILLFGEQCRWYSKKKLTDIKDFEYKDIVANDITTRFDKVCIFLDECLSKDVLLSSDVRYSKPFILLITDGQSDRGRYMEYLEELKRNRYYFKSQKYAIGVDDKDDVADYEMLLDFTQDEDNVLKVDADIDDKLENLIYNLTMTFSKTLDNSNEVKLSKKDIEHMTKGDR